MPRRTGENDGDMDMTPMIDIVFQLIIFFIVTIKLEQDVNPEIKLPPAKHGPPIEKEDPRTMMIEVDRRGWISMHGAQLSRKMLLQIMKARYQRYGQFPVLIRGDGKASHKDIKSVMDICTGVGIWKISFAAVKEKKT